MPTYAIGDIQGCHTQLEQLLDQIGFDPAHDRLWLTGDLVNRGPESLATLRYVRKLGDAVTTVLGNHDLHLLAIAAGHRDHHKKDTLHEILEAADRDELLDWLRHRPLLHYDAKLEMLLLHGGLPPQWSVAEALRYGAEVEEVLTHKKPDRFFPHMYGDTPNLWQPDLKGWERLRFITNAVTRMRYCDSDGRLELKQKGAPGSQPKGLVPWFQHSGRRSQTTTIVCGHWSTLGFYRGDGIIALDTGCLWGGSLTAVRLEDGRTFAVECPQSRKPKQG